MRRTPIYDPFDDRDDPRHEPPPPNVRRISTVPGAERTPRRGEVRPLRTARRAPPSRHGPDPRVWFIRGSIGIAALAGLWLGLQALFPVTETRVSQAPVPTQPVDASAVGAPEPPPVQAVAQQPAAPPVSQPTVAAPEGDRLPGLPTPDPAAVAQAAPQAPAAEPAAPVQPPVAAAEPTPIQPPAVAQPAAEPKPQAESPSQQPAGTPTLAPIPPPPGAQAQAPAASAAQQPAAKPQASAPAPAPAAPPPAPASSGPFELTASASPTNPISEQAMVTISVRAMMNGAPMSNAFCMATIYYRTRSAKQPNGGFTTNANGVGQFTLDARGTTYGYYIPVDVTCSGRGLTMTARTGFTPVRAAR
ncbi:MAG: hypothetical protein U0893_17315 [Chloroflexota bacterium]